jgi:hypothetical protein
MLAVRAFSACLLSLVCVAIVVAADPVPMEGADLAAGQRVARAAEQKLLQSLHKKIPAEWTDEPLEGVLKEMAKDAGIILWINQQALSDEGIDINSPVTLNLGEATIWQSLHFLLTPPGLTWIASDGVLEITTHASADETKLTRIYDVRELSKALGNQWKNSPQQPRPFHRMTIMSAAGGMFSVREEAETAALPRSHSGVSSTEILGQFGGMGGATAVIIPKDESVGIRVGTPPITSGAAILAHAIKELGGLQWEDRDGEGGTINILRGQLIVSQSYDAHLQIQSFLNVAEAFVMHGSKARTLFVARPGYPDDQDAEILKRLLAKPQEVEVNELPLETVMATLTKEAGIRLWFDRQALADEGVSLDTPVSLSLSGATLAVAMNKLLSPLGLKTVIDEGVLIVTTRAKQDEMMVTAFYDIHDILEPGSVHRVLRVVEETPGMWRLHDGEGGSSFSISPTVLAIRQTQSVHADIAALFDELRSRPAPAPAAVVAAPEFESRVYPITDATSLDDLVKTLPKIIPNWDAKDGSVHRLGETLLIKQPTVVHDQLSDLFCALDRAHEWLHPPKPAPIPTPPPAPAKSVETKTVETKPAETVSAKPEANGMLRARSAE